MTVGGGMIRLAATGAEVDPGCLDAEGGFLWWYADILNERGDGAVLIWSFGLPFLPGYTQQAREGRAPRCGDVPSLNVALYEGGEPVHYLLQRYPSSECGWDGADLWTFGTSTLRRERGEGHYRISAELDAALPGTDARLQGTITLHGAPRGAIALGEPLRSPHLWCPLVPHGQGRADLRWGGRSFCMEGVAYHDRNHAPVALDRLGIDRWIWGRVSDDERTCIAYLLWPQGGGAPTLIGLEGERSGHLREVPQLTLDGLEEERTHWGMTDLRSFRLLSEGRPWLQMQRETRLDHGPFYVRTQTWARMGEGPARRGVQESVLPARLDLARHRPLVRMRVHDLAHTTSVWNPLFLGGPQQRLTRLLRHALTR
mgnify:CR=1 FL=1